MNIIVLISDTFRWDYFGFYGNDWIQTPNFDSFAKESIIFEKAYVGSFPTIPNRTDLYTGRYCFHSKGWAPLTKEEETFPKILQRHGYNNVLVADTDHLFNSFFSVTGLEGFKDWKRIDGLYTELQISSEYPEPLPDEKMPCSISKFRNQKIANMYPYLEARKDDDHFCAQTTNAAIQWLEKNHNDGKFMLYLDTFDPHEPWVPPDEYMDLYDQGYEGEVVIHPRYELSDYLTKDEVKHMRSIYAAMGTLVDKYIGRFLKRVKELNLLENTAIIFTSDHGFYLGEHGRVGKHGYNKDNWPLWEEVAHIPLIMSLPEGPKGERYNTLIQPTDLAATIIDLAEIEIPKGLHGQSILPAVNGEVDQIRNIAVSSTGSCIVHEGVQKPSWYNLFKYSPDPEYVNYSTITDGEWSLIYASEGGHAELYNLNKDPKQKNNVFSENYDVAKKLQEEYYQFLIKIGASEEQLSFRKKL